jgi:hypothetical protein
MKRWPIRCRIGSIGVILALQAVCVSVLPHPASAEVDPAIVRQADELEKRWGDQYIKYNDAKEIARLNEAADKWVKVLTPEGRFSDLEYGPMITGRDGGKGWGAHLLRVVDLFTAWRTPGTKYTNDPTFARRAAVAFETYLGAPWDRKDTWGFGHPYADLLENNRIGRICLFARTDPKTFKQEEIERWANHILERALLPVFDYSRDPEHKLFLPRPGIEAGANLLWAVRGELVPFLVSTDQEKRIRAIDVYMKQVWDSQTVVSPRGWLGQTERLMLDGMLGEHNAPAMGSYGEWYVNAIVEYRDLIKGVERWQMPEKLNAFWIDELLDGVTPCYQGAIDPPLATPLVWLGPRKNHNAKLREWLNAFASSSTHRADEVKQVLAWDPGVTPYPFPDKSIKYYDSIQYITKHYPKWMVSMRSVSDHSFGMETFAQKEPERRWSIQSVLMPLGMCLVRRDTREYQDEATKGVWSAMDYARLPGQTTRHVTPAELAAAWNRDGSGYAVRMVFGGTPFSGGVTAGQTGVMGWWQSRYVQVDRDRPSEQKTSDLSTNGVRATFFLEDAVVHLGSGFDVRHDRQPTYTNLDQRASGSETTVYAVGDSVRTLSRGQTVRDKDITWVWHEGVGYLTPGDGEKVVQDVLQSDTDGAPTPAQPGKQVFSVFSDHGRDRRDVSFEWAVIPDITAEQMPARAKDRGWKTVSNSMTQAIEVPGKGWAGVVFHYPGAVTLLGQRVEANRPCIMILEKTPTGFKATLADPLQTDDEITITIGGVVRTCRFPGFPRRGTSTTATF